jgi:hypothetical protein
MVADRVIVENVLMLVQDVVAFADISMTTLEVINNAYHISIPLSTQATVSLDDMRCIESYSPARIASVSVKLTEKENYLRMKIVDENTLLSTTQVDIIRITKRQRRV